MELRWCETRPSERLTSKQSRRGASSGPGLSHAFEHVPSACILISRHQDGLTGCSASPVPRADPCRPPRPSPAASATPLRRGSRAAASGEVLPRPRVARSASVLEQVQPVAGLDRLPQVATAPSASARPSARSARRRRRPGSAPRRWRRGPAPRRCARARFALAQPGQHHRLPGQRRARGRGTAASTRSSACLRLLLLVQLLAPGRGALPSAPRDDGLSFSASSKSARAAFGSFALRTSRAATQLRSSVGVALQPLGRGPASRRPGRRLWSCRRPAGSTAASPRSAVERLVRSAMAPWQVA